MEKVEESPGEKKKPLKASMPEKLKKDEKKLAAWRAEH
jgi:hypothetical protein